MRGGLRKGGLQDNEGLLQPYLPNKVGVWVCQARVRGRHDHYRREAWLAIFVKLACNASTSHASFARWARHRSAMPATFIGMLRGRLKRSVGHTAQSKVTTN